MGVQPSNTKDSGNAALSGPSPSDWWRPAMTYCAAHQGCIEMTLEWQPFVGRRINEDLRLLQVLTAAKAVDEVCNAWSRFWQKAVEDYGA